jgi:hypothetical protein
VVYMRDDIFIAVKIHIVIVWLMTPCSLLGVLRGTGLLQNVCTPYEDTCYHNMKTSVGTVTFVIHDSVNRLVI